MSVIVGTAGRQLALADTPALNKRERGSAIVIIGGALPG